MKNRDFLGEWLCLLSLSVCEEILPRSYFRSFKAAKWATSQCPLARTSRCKRRILQDFNFWCLLTSWIRLDWTASRWRVWRGFAGWGLFSNELILGAKNEIQANRICLRQSRDALGADWRHRKHQKTSTWRACFLWPAFSHGRIGTSSLVETTAGIQSLSVEADDSWSS